MSFAADHCVVLSTRFGSNLPRRHTPGVCLGAWTANGCSVQSKVALKYLQCGHHILSTSCFTVQAQSYLSVLLANVDIFTESNSVWAHRVTVHVQHRWQMNMNKLSHTVSTSDLLWISTACSIGLICPCILDTPMDIEQLSKQSLLSSWVG